MSYLGTKNFALEVALGNVAGYGKINKYGEALDCDSGVDTDVWDGADGTTSTDIWVPPTTARKHFVKSTDIADDGDPAGTGMRTCRVYGLTDWDTAEVSEVVTMNGVTNAETTNNYVIVHRIVGLTFGSAGSNVGIITATAQTDVTITAAIQAGEGQTQMAIYGVPSTQTLHIENIHAGVIGTITANVQGHLLAMENADLATAGWIHKEHFYFTMDSPLHRPYPIPKSFTGPAIVKMQVNSNTNNTMVSAAFDAYIVDN
jgi:hypothetical protein